jgi:hypothetical protein
MKNFTIGKLNTVLFVFLIVAVSVVLFVPIQPLQIKHVQINGSNFKAGGEMSFTIDRCKNLDKTVSGTASRYFVDANNPEKSAIFISSTDDLGEKGCAKVTRTMDIPAHIKDGTYKLKFVTRYFPSLLREPITVEYVTEQTFTVKGQELSTQLQNILSQLETIQQNIGTEPVAVQGSVESSIVGERPYQGGRQMADAIQTPQPKEVPTLSAPMVQQAQPSQKTEQSGLVQNLLDTTRVLIDSTTNMIIGR